MSQRFVPYPLLINQFREVDFLDIFYSLSFEHYGIVILVDYYAVGLSKHHIITIVTKLTDTVTTRFLLVLFLIV